MTLIELTYNFWNLAYRDIMDKDSQNGWNNNFFHLRDVMLDNLENIITKHILKMNEF